MNIYLLNMETYEEQIIVKYGLASYTIRAELLLQSPMVKNQYAEHIAKNPSAPFELIIDDFKPDEVNDALDWLVHTTPKFETCAAVIKFLHRYDMQPAKDHYTMVMTEACGIQAEYLPSVLRAFAAAGVSSPGLIKIDDPNIIWKAYKATVDGETLEWNQLQLLNDKSIFAYIIFMIGDRQEPVICDYFDRLCARIQVHQQIREWLNATKIQSYIKECLGKPPRAVARIAKYVNHIPTRRILYEYAYVPKFVRTIRPVRCWLETELLKAIKDGKVKEFIENLDPAVAATLKTGRLTCYLDKIINEIEDDNLALQILLNLGHGIDINHACDVMELITKYCGDGNRFSLDMIANYVINNYSEEIYLCMVRVMKFHHDSNVARELSWRVANGLAHAPACDDT